jgi:hypothetical protein
MDTQLTINKGFISEIKSLIESSKQNIAVSVNAEMTILYWQIGQRINSEVLKDNRAEYGKEIIKNLCLELIAEYGGLFSEKNICRMMQVAVVFPSFEIVVSLIRQLSWTHIFARSRQDEN